MSTIHLSVYYWILNMKNYRQDLILTMELGDNSQKVFKLVISSFFIKVYNYNFKIWNNVHRYSVGDAITHLQKEY